MECGRLTGRAGCPGLAGTNPSVPLYATSGKSRRRFLHSRTSPRGEGGEGGRGGGRHRERGEEREREGDGSELMPRHLLCNWAGAGGKEMTVRFYWIIKGRSRSRSLRLVPFGFRGRGEIVPTLLPGSLADRLRRSSQRAGDARGESGREI